MNNQKKTLGIGKAFGILSVIFMLSFFSSASRPVKAEAAGMTRMDFLKSVLMAMENSEGNQYNVINFKIYSSGKIRLNKETISAAETKKIKKQFGVSLKNAAYIVIALRTGLIEKDYYKTFKKNISYRDLMIILGRADEILNGIKYTTEQMDFVVKNRISNIERIRKKTVRRAVARGYMTGIYIGSSDGDYSGTRTIKLTACPSKKTVGKLIKRLTDTSERYEFSDDWQVIRKKGLPRNAGLYSYIIADIPNEYYDTGFNGWTGSNFQTEGAGKNSLMERVGTTLGPLFVYPKEIEEFNSLKYPDDFTRRGLQYQEENRNSQIGHDLVNGAEEFYMLALNVDYRTIENDLEWQQAIGRFLDESELQKYISHCIENRTIIECDRVCADYSSVYYYDGEYNCKVYAHMRIISDMPIEKKLFTAEAEADYGYLYPLRKGWSLGSHYTRVYFGPTYLDYKLGEWTDYYFNAIGAKDLYGCLNCSNASTSLMIDYSGSFPWLLNFPYRTEK